jgi:Tfp pilus assembly protein PilF
MTGKIIIIHLIIFFNVIIVDALYAAKLVMDPGEPEKTKIFYYNEDTTGWSAIIKGKVISLSMSEENTGNGITKDAQDKTKIGVRLYNAEGIKSGDMLFVISNNNFIIGRIIVKTVSYTRSFGHILIGYGNFQFVSIGDRVVQRVDEEYSKYAYIYKGRGDYYNERGETAEAITQYKKALETDKGNPGAHLALGYIYLRDNVFQFAFKEFLESYKNVGRLYDNEDKYLLFKGMAETRYQEAYFTLIKDAEKQKYIKEGIKYAKEALALNPSSKEINFYLGIFYYKNSEPSDADARNYLVKVLELDPENVEACIVLAELYHNHKNNEKSKQYAQMALKLDPANKKAKFLLKLMLSK